MKALKKKILKAMAPDLQAIEEALFVNLEPYVPMVSHVAKYILFSGGKRIRPVLMVLSARLCSYHGDFDKTLSVVFEYLHAATLLHDDLVDGAEVRRGQPAAYTVWGNPGTVLVGDYLLARSILIATKTGKIPIIESITQTTADMSEGEIHQLVHRGNLDLSETEYMEVIRRKTACLIQSACRVGALLADAPHDQVEALTQYGCDLGYAFQLVDDLLDYTAENKILGKTTGTDLREGKMTLPLIRARSQAPEKDRRHMDAIIGSPTVDEKDFQTILEMVQKYDGISYTKKRAQAFVDRAKTAITLFEPSPTRSVLEDLADYVIMREM